MNKKLLALYGLKWNPFAPDVPVEALHVTPRIESFCWRVGQLAGEGGFALVTGAPGTGTGSGTGTSTPPRRSATPPTAGASKSVGRAEAPSPGCRSTSR